MPIFGAPHTLYRGRLAPSPTGLLHLGHARTFWVAHERARAAGGLLILRNDDLDGPRCRPEFVEAMREDLRWLGLTWDEGPYHQSERLALYRETFTRLHAAGHLYPCTCTRQDVLRALSAPHAGEEEPLYPGTCRGADPNRLRAGVNWRFRVPQGAKISFHDSAAGPQTATAGVDFGDFLVWRKDDLPSYQLATVSDDANLEITEAVRGADLITSTFRQLLIYNSLGTPSPAFHHCPLVTDEHGTRLAKRDNARSLRTLRAAGNKPADLRLRFQSGNPPTGQASPPAGK